MEKICNKCNQSKKLTEYNKNGKYLRSICKTCTNKYQINRRKNKEHIVINKNDFKVCTICNINKSLIEFDRSKDTKIGVKPHCKECKKIMSKKHYNENKQDILEQKKTYYKNNKTKIINSVQLYRDNKLKTDPLFKMKHNIRTLIRNSFKRQYTIKSKKTTEILGCDFDTFKSHIESQFDDNMNWNNHGDYWEFDHIKPISLGTTKQEIIELNHYTNFQPLYWKDNLTKSNKF